MVKKNRKRDFFEEDSPHGFVKRLMLKKYLQAYIEKTQNEKFTLDTVFIDGFAGEGRYSNDWPGEIEKYGSPLIALMVVLGFYYKRDKKEQKKCNEEKAKLEKTSGSRVLEDKNKKIEKKERTELCARASKESSEGSTEEKLGQLPGLESECKTATNADKGNIWGWLASELDPRDDLVIELEKKNRRREFVDRHSRINLIFIESDPKRYQKLAANVELFIIKFLTIHYPMYEYGFSQQERKILLNLDTGIFSIKIEIVNKKFAETAAPRMLQDKAVRSLTFLDPYGFKHTPMSHLKKFVPGTGNEILINFMSSFVNRFVSMCYEDVAKLYGIDVQDLEDEDGKAEFVQSLIRFCEPERRHEFSNNINICTVNYEAFLKTNTKCEFSLTFEIKDKGNTTFFHMVHITNHIKGVEAMKESMNRCSQEEGKMVMSDFDILRKGQKLELGNMDDPKNVAEVIFCEFRGRKRVPISDINSYVLLETPYLFRKRPLAQLQKAKNITEVVNNYGKPQSKFCTFPDKDSKTEKPINWFLSFADEGYRSESNDDPESDIKEKLKERKKILKQVGSKTERQSPAKSCNKVKKNVHGDKGTKYQKKTCTQRTESLDGHSQEKVKDEKSKDLSTADMIFEKFKGEKDVKLDKIKKYILFETNYSFRKGSLQILQRSQKMTAKREDGKTQNVKYTFPDKDRKTKEPIVWLLSFANKDYISESTEDPDADTKEITVKERKKKLKKVKRKNGKQPSPEVGNNDKSVITLRKKASTDKNRFTQTTESLAGHNPLQKVIDQNNMDLSISDLNKNNDGSESKPVEEITEDSNDISSGETRNEVTDGRKVEKENQVSRAIQQTLPFKAVKGNKMGKIKDDKERRKRQSSVNLPKNENAPKQKKARYHTLDKFFKVQDPPP